ncbi:ABC transporter ATP-binding protein [bacterium]|nr:ABC transporter ATP-binding protein [bacterium]
MWWHFDETEEAVRRQSVWELTRKVIPLFLPHARYLFAAFGLLILITASQLAGPLVLQHIIDVNIPASDIAGVLIAAAVYLGIAGGGAGVGYIQAITLFKLGINVVTDLKERLFRHVLRLGLDFHEHLPPGKLISRVESDTETLKELFGDVAVNLLRNLMLFLGIIVVLCVKNFEIAVYVLLLVPLLFAATFFFLTYMKKWWREWRAQWAIVTGYVTEYVQGVDIIQQFNYQDTARERMREVNVGKYRVEVPAMFFEYSFWGAFLFVEIIATIIVIIIGVRGVFAGTVTVGVLVLFIEYIRQMFRPIMQLSEQLNFIQRSLVSVERVFGILETKPSIDDGAAAPQELTFDREIAFEHVWFAYDREEWILRDVSFRIEKGKKLALVGLSGGGKSTIVNMLLRFYDPQRGRITVDGRDIRDFPVQAWRKLIGLVLQDVFLFPGSVADNLRVFDQSIPMERVREVSKVARADTIVEHLPGAYDGELTERGANLSVGERQLLSFARALAKNPPLLVLDEATSSVDPHTERMVQEALDRLLAGRTAVIVAHRLSTILNADLILLIHNGEVAESGRHDKLLAANGLYAKLFRLQFANLGGVAKPGGDVR